MKVMKMGFKAANVLKYWFFKGAVIPEAVKNLNGDFQVDEWDVNAFKKAVLAIRANEIISPSVQKLLDVACVGLDRALKDKEHLWQMKHESDRSEMQERKDLERIEMDGWYINDFHGLVEEIESMKAFILEDGITEEQRLIRQEKLDHCVLRFNHMKPNIQKDFPDEYSKYLDRNSVSN